MALSTRYLYKVSTQKGIRCCIAVGPNKLCGLYCLADPNKLFIKVPSEQEVAARAKLRHGTHHVSQALPCFGSDHVGSHLSC